MNAISPAQILVTSFGPFHFVVKNFFDEWAVAREWLIPSLSRNRGTVSEDDLLKKIVRGDALLVVGQQSAVIIEDAKFTDVKAMAYTYCGGNLQELREADAVMKKLFKQAGCKFVLAAGREGWGRAMGYDPFCSIFICDLDRAD